MHDGEKSVLARATLNGLAGRVVARGPPVAHPRYNRTKHVSVESASCSSQQQKSQKTLVH